MQTGLLIPKIVKWMRDYIEAAKLDCWVLGVSGGVDSSAIERLCEATGKRTICVAMPLYVHGDSASNSLRQAMELCVGRKNVEFHVREIGPILDIYQSCGVAMPASALTDADLPLAKQRQLQAGNLRSRIRANILYDFASAYRGLVAGTGNRDEDEIGYFTKGGDGLVDICALSQIHKSQVREIARELGVSEEIIGQNPTAGLWDGQTDEGELGMKYSEVEWAIRFDDLPEDEQAAAYTICSGRQAEVLAKVRRMRRVNAHKLHYPPVFPALTIE